MKAQCTSYEVLNKGWKTTCRIVLGEELGELKDYKDWLLEYLPPAGKIRSHLSGREVTLAMDHYSPESRFISSEESRNRLFNPLSINEIKDIDSIAQAISERWEYTGNRVLGNSSSVDSSDLVMDSQFISHSTNIQQSSYIFASAMARMGSKYIYGSHGFAQGEFLIRHVAGFNIKRLFESHFITESSDLYFCFHCLGCDDLLFSFFQRNKRHCIGNLQLPKDHYLPLKKKILREVSEELKKHKRFPSLFQLVPDRKPTLTLPPLPNPPEGEMEPINRAFSSTFKVIFRKEAPEIQPYEKWLSSHTLRLDELQSPFGNRTYFSEGRELFLFHLAPKSRMVSVQEGMELSNLQIKESQATSLQKVIDSLPEIAFFSAEFRDGVAKNVVKSPIAYHSSNIYKMFDATHSEHCGVCSVALNSKYIFGGLRVMESQFCINCYNSLSLSRCFEVDTSEKCSDSLFCHNSEGLAECMFCFNLKEKRYAVGNASLPPDQYRALKDSLLSQMAKELEAKKELKYSIFNIGCAGA